MQGITRHGDCQWGLFSFVLALAAVLLLVTAGGATAIFAPIHIANTDGEGVFIRPDPNTSRPAVGWMPEGASPDYHCFAWGQNINGVPIWFNVTYNGKTGYYASYYDDSSYHSNEELTAKYGVPLCGSTPPPSPSPSPAPAPSPPSGSGTPSQETPPPAEEADQQAAPEPAAIYFSPYKRGDSHGRFELRDRATITLYVNQWTTYCDSRRPQPRRAYSAAARRVSDRPITTAAGWSDGRVGVISYLEGASRRQLEQLNYVLLIDPGYYSQMDCGRRRHAGAKLAHWLQLNPKAHLVVISSSEISQKEHSRGIQETYFNAIRRYGSQLNPRVLTCNYTLEKSGGASGHEKAFFASQYWIQHQIGSTRNACPWLSVRGHYVHPTAGWHPIN